MPTAICQTCGKTRHWRAQRGARFADLRCECGGRLSMGSRVSTVRGKQFHTCGLCDQKALYVKVARVPFRLLYRNQVFPAGTEVCSSHYDSILAVDHPYFALVDAPVTRALLATWIAEIEAWIAKGRPDNATRDEWAWQREAPSWLRTELARCADDELVVLRNSIIDHVMRARGISIHDNDALIERREIDHGQS